MSFGLKFELTLPPKNDLISWLLDDAVSHQRTVRDITLRVLSSNFAAIHTTSMVYDPFSTNMTFDMIQVLIHI